MPITDRMLIGAIAGNPGQYEKAGEYRYCRECETIYMDKAAAPDPAHAGHRFVSLPALNPDGSNRMIGIFKEYIKRWTPERQDQLDRFGTRKGWDLAMELHYGGGALTDEETAEWERVVQAELQRLAAEARALIG
jgi:hypothetical protein